MTVLSILERLAQAHYLATEPDVEELGQVVRTGQKADCTYLRVVLALSTAELQNTGEKKKARRRRNQEAVVDTIHQRLYPCILRGVGSDEISNEERQRRAIFARSATSTIRAFIRDGGDIRALNVDTVTKASLRPEPIRHKGNRDQRAALRARDLIARSVDRLLKKDPEKARDLLETAIESLEALRKGMIAGKVKRTHQPTVRAAGRRVVPLHPKTHRTPARRPHTDAPLQAAA